MGTIIDDGIPPVTYAQTELGWTVILASLAVALVLGVFAFMFYRRFFVQRKKITVGGGLVFFSAFILVLIVGVSLVSSPWFSYRASMLGWSGGSWVESSTYATMEIRYDPSGSEEYHSGTMYLLGQNLAVLPFAGMYTHSGQKIASVYVQIYERVKWTDFPAAETGDPWHPYPDFKYVWHCDGSIEVDVVDDHSGERKSILQGTQGWLQVSQELWGSGEKEFRVFNYEMSAVDIGKPLELFASENLEFHLDIGSEQRHYITKHDQVYHRIVETSADKTDDIGLFWKGLVYNPITSEEPPPEPPEPEPEPEPEPDDDEDDEEDENGGGVPTWCEQQEWLPEFLVGLCNLIVENPLATVGITVSLIIIAGIAYYFAKKYKLFGRR